MTSESVQPMYRPSPIKLHPVIMTAAKKVSAMLEAAYGERVGRVNPDTAALIIIASALKGREVRVYGVVQNLKEVTSPSPDELDRINKAVRVVNFLTTSANCPIGHIVRAVY